jgi:DNA mismatch repair protein MutL
VSIARVRVLPDALANQIAAGEVVERPASVVKELVENSLDAGARSVFVLIEASGKERIRVTDDGIGMSREDARLALERHATSKLFSAEDLKNISSLGFRGEALPSIASVSHFTLRTREAEADAGYEIVVEGGKLVSEAEMGLPPGTIVDVKRLFFNVPARRKFLRSDVTESSHIAAVVSNLAACYPDVHFRLEHGSRTLLEAPSVSELRDRLYQIEKSWIDSAIRFEESAGRMSITGFVAPPAAARGASSKLHVFVNGRPVKDRILTHAVMEAYRQVSSKSGTPLTYVYLELPPAEVDVNVHPAKTEVRFVDQGFVHQALFSTLRNVLRGEGRAPEAVLESDASPQARMAGGSGPNALVREPSPFLAGAPTSGLDMAEALLGRAGQAAVALRDEDRGREETERAEGTEPPAFAEFANRPPTPLGQFRRSYILAADEENVWLIDQHAAHERILYEELVERADEVGQQLLLTPAPLELTPAESVTMEEELPALVGFGYDIEPFGEGSFVVRAVPASLTGLDSTRLLRATLSERERECRTSTVREAKSRIAARLACHAAIKVHFDLAMEKMQYLLRQLWLTRQPTVCPHGRPTTLRIGKEQLERSFGRI